MTLREEIERVLLVAETKLNKDRAKVKQMDPSDERAELTIEVAIGMGYTNALDYVLEIMNEI